MVKHIEENTNFNLYYQEKMTPDENNDAYHKL